ncbi:MAG: hypothetical protein AAF467_09860 [Actinomycetota bacterium]
MARTPALVDGVRDQAELTGFLREVRAAQADLSALVTRIGVAADRLAGRGRSAPAVEVLLDQGQVRGHTARAEAARSQVAGQVPGLADAVGEGRVGGAQLDSFARHMKHLGEADQARLPVAELICEAERLPADTFDRHLRRTVDAACAKHARADAERKRAASGVRYWYDERTGMGRISGELDPERYEMFATALDGHVRWLAAKASERLACDANLAAAALVDLVTTPVGEGGRRRPTPMSVVVDVHTLAAARAGVGRPTDSGAVEVRRTGDGRPLTGEALARLSCDAVLRRVVLDERSVPIDAGRSSRTATDAQWAALRALHDTCAWPGCGQPMSRCQIHHVRPGPTAAQPTSTISCPSAATITTECTKAAGLWN